MGSLPGGVLFESLGRGVLLEHWSPILDNDQLDFATKNPYPIPD